MKHSYYKTINKKFGQAIADYQMIQDGDQIAVGLSGGKDSVLLLWLLTRLQRIAPVDFKLKAITLDLGWGSNFTGLVEFCHQLSVPFYIEATAIGRIVFEERQESNPCSLCAHLRRGALNNLAKKLKCNKVALAHHADDAVETLLMSMFYEGRITTFLPNTYLTRQNLRVIRPLVYIREAVIQEAVTNLKLPLVDNFCPANGRTKRQVIKEIIADLEQKIPGVFARLQGSLKNIDTHQLWKAKHNI